MQTTLRTSPSPALFTPRAEEQRLLCRILEDAPGDEAASVRAAALLQRFGTLRALLHAPPAALADTQGVGPHRAARVHAALVAGHRAACTPPEPSPLIDGPRAAADVFQPRMASLPHEELHLLLLNRARRVHGYLALTRGNDRFTIVDPRQVFAPALQAGAAAVVVAHNHPSGDPTPSQQDRSVTRRLADAGGLLGVPLLDHLVVALGGWVSLAERGAIPPPAGPSHDWVQAAAPAVSLESPWRTRAPGPARRSR